VAGDNNYDGYCAFYTTKAVGTFLEGMRLSGTGGFSVGNSTFNATDPGQGVIAAQNGIIVGATTASSLLNLYGSGPQIKFVNSADGNTTQYVGLTTGTPGGTGFGVWGDTGTALFVRRVDGNVGIGTTAPAALLSVGSSSQFQVNSAGVSSAGAGSTDLNGSGVPEAHCLADGTGCPGYALASGPTSWTPTDASGAGLTFTGVNVSSSRVGNMVFVYGSLSYPVTANINTAQIGGLPIAVSSGSYAFTPNGAANSTSPAVAYRCLPQGGTLSFTLTATSSSLSPTNANLSGSPLFFSFSYPIN
jgi:hypothetical protein